MRENIQSSYGVVSARQKISSPWRAFGSAALLALVAASGACSSGSEPGSGRAPEEEPQGPGDVAGKPPLAMRPVSFAPGSVIVRFKSSLDAAGLASARANVLSRIKGSFVDKNGDGIYDRFAHLDRSGHLYKIDLDRSVSVDAALAELRADPAVAYAEPNYVQYAFGARGGAVAGADPTDRARALLTPNDPRFAELYGLHNTGQTGGAADADIDAPEAWETSTGSSDIVVGVIDTGIDYTHPDLAANVWVNPGEIAGNGVDDDGNGVVDDVHGYNAINGSGDPMDDHSHGTHCSGTIGATGQNNVGVVGVNWSVSIMGIKFLDSFGSGTLEDAVAAIDYAVGQKRAGVNLRVLSNSWGGGGYSQALKDAIEIAGDEDILFVAAAGNDYGNNNDVFPTYPGSYDSPSILAVAATNSVDGLAYFSSIGPTTVDLGAPGQAILSTTPNNTYDVYSGTSMATPHVSGAAALVLSNNDTLSTEELKQLLMDSGDAKAALATTTLSGKRLNAANALAQAGPPTPRFNLGASPASARVNQADSATYALDLSSVAGFTGEAAMTVTVQPAIDATVTVTPSAISVPGSAQLTVATTMTTAPGHYTLLITGTSGSIVRTRQVALQVRPFGTIEESYPSTDTPLTIPDWPASGISSVLHVDDSFALQQVKVDLSITHPYNNDIIATLTSPSGTEVTLQSMSYDNPNRTFLFPVQFAGEQAEGNWTLHVSDAIGGGIGTLNSWTLHLSNEVSQADFALSTTASDLWVRQDYSIYTDVQVDSIEGFSSPVSLSLTSSPSLNAYTSFSPVTVTPSGSSDLYISTGCATTPGSYDLTVTGQSGSVARDTAVKLSVIPDGAPMFVQSSFDTPRSIPDNNPNGTTSSINVYSSFQVSKMSVGVNITHPSIGQLEVQLISPSGQMVKLHDRTGGDDDNLVRYYDVTDFAGQGSYGNWQLKVIDRQGTGTGSLVNWTMRVADTRLLPTADFSYTQTYLAFQMVDYSHDAGTWCSTGSIVSWHWDFGDGATSELRNPSHTYAQAGEYDIALTVTDNDGNAVTYTRTVAATRPPPQLAIERITRNRTNLEFSVDLTWSGAEGTHVDLRRNSALVDIPNNDGAHRDTFRRYETAFDWQICEQQSNFCSNTVSVNFGSSLSGADGGSTEPTEATITTRGADGVVVTRTVQIEVE